MTDLQEYLAGTDPTVAASNLRLIPVMYNNGTNFVSSFMGVAGKTYRVEYSSSLLPGSWVMLGDYAPSAAGPISVIDGPVTGISTRFYRVKTPAGP
jgi:hypothetical protein